jgi:hypothetical protein
MIKTCAACGKSFGCFSQDCWCAELPHVMPMNPDSDCLCEDCLKKAVAKKTG